MLEQTSTLQPLESLRWSRLLAGAVPHAGPMLEESAPEGQYPVQRTHTGAVRISLDRTSIDHLVQPFMGKGP